MGGACQKNHLLKSADKLQQDTPLRLKESDKMETFLGILIPFLGTTLGAACVFFMKKSLGDLVQRSLAGFAAGVMVAASIWSLLIPAIEQSEDMGKLSFLPAFLSSDADIPTKRFKAHPNPHGGVLARATCKKRTQRPTGADTAVTSASQEPAFHCPEAVGRTRAGSCRSAAGRTPPSCRAGLPVRRR